MRKNLIAFYVLLSLFLFIFSGCAGKTGAADQSFDLVVLHTNDHHGMIVSDNGTGSLAERAAFIKGVRAGNPYVLLLDAGDINTRGQGLSELADWRVDIDAYNLMEYDAMSFGNHEFDKGLALLAEQMRRAKFPFLAANIKKPDGSYLGKPWIVKEYNGVRVGIFGLTVTNENFYGNLGGQLIFLNTAESAKEAVRYLREQEKCGIVIALVHLGIGDEGRNHGGTAAVANSVPGIDLMVDGHSETFIEEPLVINGVPVITAFHYGEYIGEAHLKVSGGGMDGLTWKLVPVTSGTAPDPDVEKLVASFKAEKDSILNEKLATASGDFEQDFSDSFEKETAAGDMVNDATVWYVQNILKMKADFAFTNGGTLRVGPKKGEITGKIAYDLLPFENNIMIVEMQGADVIRLFGYMASLPSGHKGWAQVSREARYTIDYTKGDGVLKNLTIGGKAVLPDAAYAVATNDFITRGGNGYKMMGTTVDTEVNLRKALTEYMKYMKMLNPVTDGRIKVIK